jgi:peroxin-5
VNALLSSLDIDGDVRVKGPLPGRFQELEDYWNESQAAWRPGPPQVDRWVTEFSQHRIDHGDPNVWAHSFEQQHGANGWASEFEQVLRDYTHQFSHQTSKLSILDPSFNGTIKLQIHEKIVKI